MQLQSQKAKKSYHKPQLSVYGDIETFTLATGNTGNMDATGQGATSRTQI